MLINLWSVPEFRVELRGNPADFPAEGKGKIDAWEQKRNGKDRGCISGRLGHCG